MKPPFLLFDDNRSGGQARLYRRPSAIICADRLDAVRPALARIRQAVAAGAHAAGYLAYEAGQALDDALADGARIGEGPLLWFGLFDAVEQPDMAQLLPDSAGASLGEVHPRWTYPDYEPAALQVREHLFAGDFYQANLTFGCDVRAAGSPLAIYARLRARSRAGWGGVIDTGNHWLASLSPEQFFTIRDGEIEAKPMKGTAPRGVSPEDDRALAEELAADPKQRAENLMIVDLMRNDLARVAELGSVAVPDLFAVETYPTLHQLVSRITARLRAGADAVSVLETIFPCGSITGAPKIAAIKALRGLEPEPRGAYTGSMGWIAPDGDAAFNVLIRTLEGRHGENCARLGLGSGLVVDSEPRDEWGECLLKGKFVAQPERSFDLIETMGFDPHDGVVELDRHLDRMSASSADLDFRFDRHAARNELQAATFGRKRPAMVRLLLARSGAMAIQLKTLGSAVQQPVEVALRPLPVDPADFRLRYKTTDRSFYDDARRDAGTWEIVFYDTDGRITEGSRTNVFVERAGGLVTPRLNVGIMPGVLRAKLIDEGKAIEGELTEADLRHGFLVGNSARGLLRAVLA